MHVSTARQPPLQNKEKSMDSKQVGILVQELAAKEKKLYELIVEGNKMVQPLRNIADWLNALNDPNDPQPFTFEEHNNTFRSPRGQSFKAPQDLKGHIRDVLNLQNEIDSLKRKLIDALGIDVNAKYSVSIKD